MTVTERNYSVVLRLQYSVDVNTGLSASTLILLQVLLSTSCFAASSGPSCEALFSQSRGQSRVQSSEQSRAKNFLSGIANSPAAFNVYRDKGVFDRFWNRQEVIDQAFDMATSPANKEHLLIISEDLRMKYSVDRSDSRLRISIPLVRIAGVELGARTKGLSLDFIKFMTGVLRAVEQEKIANPRLKTVRIEADKIMNADLIVLLEGLGFSKVQRSTLVDLVLDFELEL